jgi:hypothetical protein
MDKGGAKLPVSSLMLTFGAVRPYLLFSPEGDLNVGPFNI